MLLGCAMVLLFGVLAFADPPFFRLIDTRLYHFYSSLFPSLPPLATQHVHVAEDILKVPFISQPVPVLLTELIMLMLLGSGLAFFSARCNEKSRFFLFSLLLGITLATAIFFFAVLHSWVRVTAVVGGLTAAYLAVTFYRASIMETLARETVEANRTLGLSLQRQGHLDEAFERYQCCPPDRETRELFYQLALDFEQRGERKKALQAYRQIREIDFKDVEDRIRQLQTDTPGEGSHYFPGEEKGLSESFLRSRKSVGRYHLIEKLGKGTTGLVYKGSDPRLNRLVAIKIIRFSDDFEEEMIDDIRERFLREAEIAGRLSHPGIVTIHDVGEDEDLTYMAMEYLEGQSLIRYASKERKLPFTTVLDVAAKIADALDYAHKHGVIHRDIKPANIMLLRDGNVKVTDFGIAKAMSSTRTKTGVILGTPNYMSPEQIMGHKIDARTDIFSLGVLLFQLLTGKLPFRGENLSGLLYHITQGKHPSIRLMESGIPKACEQIIDKALAKNPRDRFRTAGQMARYVTMLLDKIDEIKKKRESAATTDSPPLERETS